MYELQTTTWMILICIILSERIQNQKVMSCDFIFMIFLKRQNYEEIKQIRFCKGRGWWRGQLQKDIGKFFGEKKLFYVLIVAVVM